MKKFSKQVDSLSQSLRLDLPYFIRGGSAGLVQQIIGIICGAVVMYLFGHFVNQTTFGEYNLVLSYISLFTSFSLPGMDTAVVQSVSQGYDKSFLTAARSKIYVSIIGAIITFSISFWYFIQQKISTSYGLLVAAICFPLLFSLSVNQAFLTAKRKFGLLAFITSASSIFFVLVTGVIIFFSRSTGALILSYCLGLMIPNVISFLYIRRFVTSKKIDSGLLSYGSFLTLLGIIPWISGNVGNIVLGSVLGVEKLALYSVAIGFLVSVQKITMVFYKPITAKLARQTITGHSQTLTQHTWKFLLIGCFFSLSMWVSLPLLVKFFYSPAYRDAIKYAQWLSLALIPLPISWVVSDMIVYQKRQSAQIVISTLPQLLKIILFILVIPGWGIGGLIGVFLLDRFTAPFIPLFALKSKTKVT